MLLIVLALIFLSVTLLSIAFSIMIRNEELKKEQELKDRLQYIRKQKTTEEKTKKTKTLNDVSNVSNLLKPFIPKNIADRIADKLSQADVPLRVNDFLIISFVFVVNLSIFGLIIGRDPSVGFLFFLVGLMLPHFYLKGAIKKKIKKFDAMLANTITMIANTLKSGFGLRQALQVVAEEMPPPVSTEFRKVIQEIVWGLTQEEALSNLNKRIPSEDLDLMVTSILIQCEIGGNLSDILSKIAETIRERKRIKGEVNSLTAQGKVSGVIIGALPIVIGGMIFTINPKYMLSLFTHPLGLVALGMAIFLEVIGAVIIKKIIALDV
ncbi:type II secretion system F family protein [Candidatus Margulisiibacteriota bacterium]